MSITINALSIRISAGGKRFGINLKFAPSSLNVIRADNTSGKSTIFNSIVYALGFEAILGASKHIPLTYTVADRFKHGDEELKIVESAIYIELTNGQNQVVTIRRQVVGQNDQRLVQVIDGPFLTAENFSPSKVQDFYVRYKGAATNEKGFHTWLSQFIGWTLPTAAKFSGESTLLYLECIAPLFIIEQKKGWSQIQATVPTQYGIRDVRQKAIEFVLKLDSAEIERQRQELSSQWQSLKVAWLNQVQAAHRTMKAVYGGVDNLPNELQVVWPKEPAPVVYVRVGGTQKLLSDHIRELKDQLRTLNVKPVATTSENKAEAEKELLQAEEDLFQTDVVTKHAANESSAVRNEIEMLHERQVAIEEELRQFKDAELIAKFGGANDLPKNIHNCPVCSNELDGTVLSQSVQRYVMDLSQNINFLDSEKSTVESLLTLAQERKTILEEKLSELREHSFASRDRIRILKTTLTDANESPSLADIEKRISLKKNIEVLELAENEVTNCFEVLDDIAIQAVELKKLIDGLPEKFSPSDEKKLETFQNYLKKDLKEFQFGSFDPIQLSISRFTLQPTVEDFDWYFEASGSDNIRAIWAYSLALLQTSFKAKTNHLRLLMFDEPRQHSAKGESLSAFFRVASEVAQQGSQVIITTSETDDDLANYLREIECHLISFAKDQKVLGEI